MDTGTDERGPPVSTRIDWGHSHEGQRQTPVAWCPHFRRTHRGLSRTIIRCTSVVIGVEQLLQPGGDARRVGGHLHLRLFRLPTSGLGEWGSRWRCRRRSGPVLIHPHRLAKKRSLVGLMDVRGGRRERQPRVNSLPILGLLGLLNLRERLQILLDAGKRTGGRGSRRIVRRFRRGPGIGRRSSRRRCTPSRIVRRGLRRRGTRRFRSLGWGQVVALFLLNDGAAEIAVAASMLPVPPGGCGCQLLITAWAFDPFTHGSPSPPSSASRATPGGTTGPARRSPHDLAHGPASCCTVDREDRVRRRWRGRGRH